MFTFSHAPIAQQDIALPCRVVRELNGCVGNGPSYTGHWHNYAEKNMQWIANTFAVGDVTTMFFTSHVSNKEYELLLNIHDKWNTNGMAVG